MGLAHTTASIVVDLRAREHLEVLLLQFDAGKPTTCPILFNDISGLPLLENPQVKGRQLARKHSIAESLATFSSAMSNERREEVYKVRAVEILETVQTFPTPGLPRQGLARYLLGRY